MSAIATRPLRVQCRVSPVALMLSPSLGASNTTPVAAVRGGSRPKPLPRPNRLVELSTAGMLASGMLWRTFRSLPTLTPAISFDRLRPKMSISSP
ncbi:hypothetical protein FQZ97_931650 [compost metagenome]